LSALAKDREAVAVASQRFEQGQRIGNQLTVLMLPVKERERKWEHERTEEIE
jgi:hypothetical protein